MTDDAREPSKTGVRNLILRGSVFYAELRHTGGPGLSGTHLRKSLKTRSRADALRRLPAVLAELRAKIESARRDVDGNRHGRRKTPAAEAEYWRQRLRETGYDPASPFDSVEFETHVDDLRGIAKNAKRERSALEFVQLVRGERLPLEHHLDRYLRTLDKPSYQSRVKRAAGELKSWLKSQAVDDCVNGMTRKTASRFIEHLVATDRSPATVMSYVSALAAYWTWLGAVGEIESGASPWRGQPLPKRSKADKRAFTDDEVVKLLAGETSLTLHDLMRVAALSGMRVNEIARLRVKDAVEEAFNVVDGKTDNSLRRVPSHPDLKVIVARRMLGKPPEAYLFDELKAPKSNPRNRAHAAIQRFSEYRRDPKVGTTSEGRRQADADLHSFRRWFITAAERADQPPHIISAVVGHARQGMTLGRYSDGPSFDVQMRRVVEAVKLPKEAAKESPAGPRLGDSRRGRMPARTIVASE